MSQTGTPEGDHLLATIRQIVHGRVPEMYEELVVEAVARTVVVIFSDPSLYSHLRLVQDLQSRVIQLERVVSLYQQGHVPVKAVKVKKAAKSLPVKGPVKKSVSKKGPASLNVRQFKRGASGH